MYDEFGNLKKFLDSRWSPEALSQLIILPPSSDYSFTLAYAFAVGSLLSNSSVPLCIIKVCSFSSTVLFISAYMHILITGNSGLRAGGEVKVKIHSQRLGKRERAVQECLENLCMHNNSHFWLAKPI